MAARERLPLAACTRCRKPIVWGQTADGTKVPLEMRRTTAYRFLAQHSSHVEIERGAEPVFVSHFLTCPHADEFSGRSQARSAAAQNHESTPDHP